MISEGVSHKVAAIGIETSFPSRFIKTNPQSSS
jgi:hypothetical protein